MHRLLTALLIVLLSGCTNARAPVSARGVEREPDPTVSRPDGAVVTRPARTIRKPANGPDGRYTVRPGDTLYSVAWQHGLTFGELARQNRIHPPYTIYPGQHLRVSAPTRPVAPVRIQPVPGPAVARPATPVPAPKKKAATASKPVAKAPKMVPKPAARHPAPAAAKPGGATVFDGRWTWPTRGRVLRGFKPGGKGKKGIDIGGHHAQPVKAAAAGKVVYAGSGLVGYGRLIIVKHNENLLSAYGHNSKLLVAEGDHVKAGEMIAKMGNSGTDRTALYFEIRKDGKPVNPLHYLPRN